MLSYKLIFVILLGLISGIQNRTSQISVDLAKNIIEMRSYGRGIIKDVEWSPNEDKVVVTSSSGVWLYNATDLVSDPNPTPLLNVYDGEILDFEQNLGQRFLITQIDDGTVSISNLEINKDPIILNVHSGKILSTDLSTDGRILAVSRQSLFPFEAGTGDDFSIRLWNLDTKTELPPLNKHTAMVTGIKFSPNNHYLASTSNDGTVRIWDVTQGKTLYQINNSIPGNIIAFSPDGLHLAIGNVEGVQIWDVETGRALVALKGTNEGISDITFSADNQLLGVGYSDGTINIWELNSGTRMISLQGHTGKVVSVNFNSDRSRLISGSLDNTVRGWDLRNGELIFLLDGYTQPVNDALFDLNNEKLITAYGNQFGGAIRLWDLETGEEDSEIHTPRSIDKLELTPDSKMLIAEDSHNIQLWDFPNLTKSRVLFEDDNLSIRGLAISSKGTLVFTYHNTIRLWDSKSLTEQMTHISHDDSINDLVFSSDGSTVVSVSGVYQFDYIVPINNLIEFWQTKPLIKVDTYSLPEAPIMSVAISSNDNILALGLGDGTIKLWDLFTRKELLSLKSKKSMITSLVFSLDGTLLISGSEDSTIRLWDVKSGNEVMTLSNHLAGITSLNLNSDGTMLVSGSKDGTTRLWGIP